MRRKPRSSSDSLRKKAQRRALPRLGRVLRSIGILLVLLAVANIGLALLPLAVKVELPVRSSGSWTDLVPEPLSTYAEQTWTFLEGHWSTLPHMHHLSGADSLLLWLPAGALGLLLLACGKLAQAKAKAKAKADLDDLPVNIITSSESIPAPGSELSSALRSCKGALVGVAVFSGVSNVLMLTGAIFMLQIYDRVLPSRSVPTLVALSLLAGALFIGQAVIDLVRGRVMSRIGAELDEAVGERVFSGITALHSFSGQQADGLQPQRDLDSIRMFLSSPGPNALFELPWLPFYLAIIWSFHPILGITATCGAAVLTAFTVTTEFITRKPMSSVASSAVQRNRLAEAARRNAEVLLAMGMTKRLHGLWREASREHLRHQQRVSDVTGGFGSFARSLRLMLQSAMLGVGAWLVIYGEATAGIIIAGSILAGRALAPVDLAIAHWRNFVAARQSWNRLNRLLACLPLDAQPMALPVPSSNLTVERVAIAPPGVQRITAQGVEFSLGAGTALGIIGPSGSGKSTLVRALVGAWRPLTGRIKLDGASLDQWPSELLGRYLGYLPQDVELLAGTVAENISRFEPNAEPEAIVSAAKAASVHELIINLPNGYETQIGDNGAALSAGQRQRVALARALYGDPFLIVLDEPNSNLDSHGDIALLRAIRSVRARGGIVVIVAHRTDVLATVDFVLVMRQGRMHMFGPRERVLAKLAEPAHGAAPSVKPVFVEPDASKTAALQ